MKQITSDLIKYLQKTQVPLSKVISDRSQDNQIKNFSARKEICDRTNM